MSFVDNFLNKITMYRLMLYYLILLLVAALILSFFGLLPFSPVSLLFSASFIILICWITNKAFSLTLKVPTNLESVYVSALILSLIITPARSLQDFIFLFWVSVLAMASKYLLAINKKHIFNPVAIALVLASLLNLGLASWWVGTASMFPFILPGILIIRKIQRWNLFLYFSLAYFSLILGQGFVNGNDLLATFENIILNSPLLFFAFVMLVEPLTAPPVKFLQSSYGAVVGLIMSYVAPEIALILGNIFSYLVSPKIKLFLNLKSKVKIASGIYDFVFVSTRDFSFIPGQYLEWTLGHRSPDSRGNRRYFTIASSPTESNLRIGVKFYPNGSSFKKALSAMNADVRIVASQLSGEFTLPKNPKQKLVFIAGGIGITPFRSMIKYLLDKNEKRSVVLFYANKVSSEIAYADIFDQAKKELGIKTVYTLTDENAVPKNWQGKVGRISDRVIAEEVPDYSERFFYLSGPRAMVSAFENTLKNMGVSKKRIKTDFFPGYA